MNWQERYQSGDTPWNKGVPAPSISQLKTQLPNLFKKGKIVLAPGCGFGHDAIAIAQAGPSVTGADLAEMPMVEAAKNSPPELDLTWLTADAFTLPERFPKHFDIIWEHTFFCAINPSTRPQYVESMHKLLKPNGLIAGVFFTNPDTEQGPPFKATREEIISTLGSHFALEWEATPTHHFPEREGREHIMLFRKLHSCEE